MKLNWGQSIFVFFVIFVSLGVVFIIFSLRQNNDLVEDDYYEQGANYTRQMEITDRSAVYKDSIQLNLENGVLVARFSKSISNMADTLYIDFYRPSDKRLDCGFLVLLNADSVVIDKGQLVKGRYTVKFRWNGNQNSYLVEKEYFSE
jgi:hypothetical protein